jgi:hypothetical protein
MTEPTLQKYFQDDPPSLFDQINGKVVKIWSLELNILLNFENILKEKK